MTIFLRMRIMDSKYKKRRKDIIEMVDKNETPNEKFKRIAATRTQKIINMIELLGNCSNQYVYAYSQEDVDKIFSAIETELKLAKEKYKGNGKTKEKFTL